MPPLTILYAEDDTWLMLNVKELLEEEGWRVDACGDGATALGKIESDTPYDLLLLDNRLPEVSGLELVRRARVLSHRQHTPIIVLSASEASLEARRAGADLFLKKTKNIYEIVEHILTLTGRS